MFEDLLLLVVIKSLSPTDPVSDKVWVLTVNVSCFCSRETFSAIIFFCVNAASYRFTTESRKIVIFLISVASLLLNLILFNTADISLFKEHFVINYLFRGFYCFELNSESYYASYVAGCSRSISVGSDFTRTNRSVLSTFLGTAYFTFFSTVHLILLYAS